MSAQPDHETAPAPSNALEAYREQLRREKLRRQGVDRPTKRRRTVAKVEVKSVEVAEVETAERRRLALESVSEVERRIKERVQSFLRSRELLESSLPRA